MLFFLLLNVKMQTVVDMLTFMSRKNSKFSELSMKKVSSISSGLGHHRHTFYDTFSRR